MNTSNLYAVPETAPGLPVRFRLREQQLLRQAILFSIFYFAGFAFLIAVVAGINAVPQYCNDVVEDFTSVWLFELMFALVPYVTLRALTFGRLIRPSWWSFCISGVATFPFLNLYSHLLFRYRDTPYAIANIAAHLLSVLSAILTERLAVALFGRINRRIQIAEQRVAPQLPSTVSH